MSFCAPSLIDDEISNLQHLPATCQGGPRSLYKIRSFLWPFVSYLAFPWYPDGYVLCDGAVVKSVRRINGRSQIIDFACSCRLDVWDYRNRNGSHYNLRIWTPKFKNWIDLIARVVIWRFGLFNSPVWATTLNKIIEYVSDRGWDQSCNQ
jgi:hypothetical protein